MAQPDNKAQHNKFVIPENVSEFYANAVNVATTDWDVMMLFGTLMLPQTLPAERNNSDIRVDAVIRMSPQHAKATMLLMKKMIEDFEKRHGTINIPLQQKDSGK